MDLQDKPVTYISKTEQPDTSSKKMPNFEYVNKFKSAAIGFVLFIVLSHNVSYKVLDLILKTFNSNILIIDSSGQPQILGTLIFAIIIAVILFIF